MRQDESPSWWISTIRKSLWRLPVLYVSAMCLWVLPAWGQVERTHLPVVINYYNNSGLTSASAKVDEMIREANRILRENDAGMMLWVIEENDDAEGGDAGADGDLHRNELEDINKAGKDEIEATPNQIGLKISFVRDAWVEKPVAGGWNYTGEPVVVLEDADANRLARKLVHEMSHAFGNKEHSTGADDVTNATGSGENIPDDFLAKMKSNRRQFCKCSTQFDSAHPGVRDAAQRGRKTDERGSGGGELVPIPAYLDLATTWLLSLDGNDLIDGYLAVDGLFEGVVDATYVLTFDSDNSPTSGSTVGPFFGREYSLVLWVTGDFVGYSVFGLVREEATGQTWTLPTPPVLEVSELDGTAAFHQIYFSVEKERLGLDISLLPSSPADVPVGVFVEESSVIYDTNSFLFRMDQWLRDPVLETFGNGVPQPGEPYAFEIRGLLPSSPFSLYVDEDQVLSGVLDATGGASGEFLFPDISNTVPHFFTAQDSTGEIAYNTTCPDPAPIFSDGFESGDLSAWTHFP